MDHLVREALADGAQARSAARRLQQAVWRLLGRGHRALLGVTAGGAAFTRADASPPGWVLRRSATHGRATRRVAPVGTNALTPFVHIAVEARGGSRQTACGRPGAAVIGSGLKEVLRVTCPACRAYCEGAESPATRLARWWRRL